MPFITADNPLWPDILKRTEHDLYHLPEYCAIEAWMLGGEAMAWVYENEGIIALIPLISRPVESCERCFDLVSPYGYPGVLCSRRLSGDEAENILRAFDEEAVAAGYLTTFLRLNPFYNNWVFSRNLTFRQVIHGNTVSVDLKQPFEVIRKTYSENHRRNLRNGNESFYVRTNDYQSFHAFIEAYNQTMQRKKANPYYFFPETYFTSLRHLLGEKLMYIALHNSQDDDFVGGGLFTLFGNIMQFHLGATTNKGLLGSPSKLMIDTAIQLGIGRKASLLHLGGGLGASTSDGLFRFKKGFGNTLHTFSSLRFIHQPEKYAQLTLRGIDPPESASGFFPAYRR
ncbi:MAG: hypothetical protein IPM52_10490 [Bacteroidetes bacterium]|nr:hypothetical protein [Bacteroidota bacterium]